ncbi:nucleotidyltransferase family protein [Polynucleobacter sp. AM-25C3]|nr:nucleotidyltransferase family protein [Polynucleobacter sp. AM-25C3]
MIIKSPEPIWSKATLNVNSTIGEVVQNLDQLGIKIVLVTKDSGELEGTISDGDIRRALLRGLNLKSSITSVIHRNALVVPPDLERALVRQLMIANKIQQIPVVDDKNCVVGMHLWDEVVISPIRDNIIIIMAGGKGKRMRPFTESCPKPLLLISGKPMLEHIINRAKQEGFNKFILAIQYLGHMIEEYFGDGSLFGVNITYLREDSPLGTAGALSLLDPIPEKPFLVTNGDVITDIRYGELLDFHERHGAVATMAVRLHEWQHPFGVVHTQGIEITGFEEKPVSLSHINAGVYALNPEALDVLSSNESCDMPALFESLKGQRKLTIAYPMHEPWLDVGRPDDFERAQINLDALKI